LRPTQRFLRPPWSSSTSSLSATAMLSSVTSGPPTSGWKSATRSSIPPTCALRRWPRMLRSSSRPPRASFLRHSFCVLPRRSGRPTRKTTWSAMECRRLQPQCSVHHLQQDGHLSLAALSALSRHSPSR
jgi:hypothetical protein